MVRLESVSKGVLALLVALAAIPALAVENIDPASDDHQYAWGENQGWFNAEPSGNGGPGVFVDNFALSGWMWGENAGWVSMSCTNTATCGNVQYGVTNDGFGNLGGFAWGENIGWINFAPQNCGGPPTCGVRINPVTGRFDGMAWGENIGWVNFTDISPLAWSIRTSWCSSTSGPPGSLASLSVARNGGTLTMAWVQIPAAAWYDASSGSLSLLQASGGNFSLATRRCEASKAPGPTLIIPVGTLTPGDGSWYSIRASNCRGNGSFNENGSSQVGDRDAEIAGSPLHCP